MDTATETTPSEAAPPAVEPEAAPVAQLPADLNDDGIRAALANVKATVAGLEVPILDVLAYASCRRMATKGCRGRGFTLGGGKLTICGCALAGWRRAHAPVALTEEQAERTVPGLRHVPQGARERLVRLKRELALEEERLATARTENDAAVAGITDELVALQAEEAANKRGLVGAEAEKKLASAQLEEVRAKLEGLRTVITEADATTERLTAQAGQFGARRMSLEAQQKTERDKLAPVEKAAADRADSLRYRLDQHFAHWPELQEASPS